ncbi:MAG: d(CMP) kinase [Alphaproteobacteria bacterium]
MGTTDGQEPPLVIAIDGPSAAGKGTVARKLAAHYRLAYLDTGSLYRATALRLRRAGHPAGSDPAPAEAALAARCVEPADLVDPELRHEDTGRLASRVAAIPEVRAALRDYQRDFARNPPKSALLPAEAGNGPSGRPRGAVLDGRDIGTVVWPEASIKLFVTARPEVRADRRLKELQDRGVAAIKARVLADLVDRDSRDSERAVSPLKPAEDAFVLDTSEMDANQVFDMAVQHISATLDQDI